MCVQQCVFRFFKAKSKEKASNNRLWFGLNRRLLHFKINLQVFSFLEKRWATLYSQAVYTWTQLHFASILLRLTILCLFDYLMDWRLPSVLLVTTVSDWFERVISFLGLSPMPVFRGTQAILPMFFRNRTLRIASTIPRVLSTLWIAGAWNVPWRDSDNWSHVQLDILWSICMLLPLFSLHATQLQILKNCNVREENYIFWHSISSWNQLVFFTTIMVISVRLLSTSTLKG